MPDCIYALLLPSCFPLHHTAFAMLLSGVLHESHCFALCTLVEITARFFFVLIRRRLRTPSLLQAFGVAKYGKAHRVVQRNLDRAHHKEHVPLAERTSAIAPPITVVVMGPAGVGKTTLIKVSLCGALHAVLLRPLAF